MSRSGYFLIVATVWIAPLNPDWVNWIVGAVNLVTGTYYLFKDKK